MGEPEKGKTWNVLGWVRREKAVAALFVALTLVVGILIGTVVSGHTSAMKTMTFAGKGATPLPMPDAIPSSNSFASIVNRVEPAVVNISTTQVMEKRQTLNKKRRQAPNPNGDDDPMQDFFDRFFDGRNGGQDAPPAAERSLGSGVIVDRKGFILTNNHVVEQATKIQVQLNGDTTRYNAKVVGTDEETDLAVIKIE
ncbi:MAG TPA: trypsin-like peptidase domain-containing protein, partial [Candidatus Acidoferrum sp.]|nr:trypsin-like peptidase domain-containing protein [Candidatus Acidoferrum sp.]